MTATRLTLAACLLHVSSGYGYNVFAPRCAGAPARQAHRTAVTMAADGDVKVTIKRPGAASTTADPVESKVSVKVRPPSEQAGAVSASTPEVEMADMTTSIKVNRPEPVAAPPSPPKPKLTEEEELLLAATQAANCTQILEALQMGANPNICDPKGRTPLHFMSGVGLAPATVLLIHFGAQLDVQDEDGLTPLHMAAGYANARSLRVLVAAGADINLTGKGQGTPFEVVKGLGEYQYDQVYGDSKKKRKPFEKKDEKLQKLKQCVDILTEPEKVREENKWETLLEETLRLISI